MKFKTPLIKATLIKRYKRFLADVSLESGEIITIHTANTGTMLGCSAPGSTVWISDSQNPKRKCRYSWELTELEQGALVGINTMLSNHLVKEGIENSVIKELQGFDVIRSEVQYGSENSRIDLLLENESKVEKCYVEVKNVTAVIDGMALFPDAVSKRGAKHLRELIEMVNEGYRAVMCFCVQREDASVVRPADEIDKVYGETLRHALDCGVEAIAYMADLSVCGIKLVRGLPVVTTY